MLSNTGLQLVNLGIDEIKKVPTANFSSSQRNDAIRDKFFEIMGTDKFDVMAWERHKYECFEVLREIFKQTIASGEGALSDFYNQFVDERDVELGDTQELIIENEAYLTVGKVSGNNWDLDRQRMDKGAKIAISTDAYYVKIYEYFKRFLTRRMDWDELYNEVNRSIKKFKDDFVAKVFSNGVDGLPEEWFFKGTYDEASIQKVIDNVTASNNGADIVLTGTKSALNKMQGITATNLSDAQKLEYQTNGYLRNWKGYTCVELPTLFKQNSISEFVFDLNTVYFLPVGAKPVTIVVEGDPIIQETDEIGSNKDMTKEFATIFRIGGAFVMNRIIGGCKLS